MPLTAGTQLGPYEIVAPIGSGGMGEVYRARDTRLHREVAIKVLPAAVGNGVELRARFEREARAVAALSHPNILALHDYGTENGIAYAVTELLTGETVRARLTSGALPLRKAIEVAVHVARGLAAAHDKQLVHRDLKPENLFLLDDGQVKILDFGLARQIDASADSSAAQTTVATDPGTVMGTVGYMAPEQVRGLPTDARTDLFALGCVLYEMLSGRRAFERESAAETMTAIVKDEPADLLASRADLSPSLDRIVRHCLEKTPAERFQSARDVAFALEALSGTGATASVAAVTGSPRRRWPIAALATGVAMLAAGLGLGALAASRLGSRAAAPLVFEAKTFDSHWITNARFAPDSRTIIFSAAAAGNTPSLFVIRPDSVVPQRLGPEGIHLLSVSSKGELAVITGTQHLHHRVFNGTLARMSMDGASRPWLENVREADWSPDGSALAAIHVVNGRDQIEYPLGQAQHTTAGYLSDPRVSPDGRQVAFFEHAYPGDDRGWVKVVGGSAGVRTLTEEYWGIEGLAWSPDGKSVYFGASSSAHNYQPFIVDAAGGSPARAAFSSAGDTLVYDVSPGGQMLAVREDRFRTIRGLVPGESVEREFRWLSNSLGGYFSVDGRWLLFTDLNPSAGSDYAVSLRGTDGSPVSRLGPGAPFGLSPDAKWALAIVPSTQRLTIYPTGTGNSITLPGGVVPRYNAQWFADGRRVLFCGNEASRPPRCYEQSIAGGSPKPVTPDGVEGALISPDERTLLLRTSAGAFELAAFGGSDTRPAKGFAAGDRELSWSRDGRFLFVQASPYFPARVDRVDPVTGARTTVKSLVPPDSTGVTMTLVEQWLDGLGYTYRVGRTLSTLYLATQTEGR
jgi:eukaryotic-like serine/threonine-protein kinase